MAEILCIAHGKLSWKRFLSKVYFQRKKSQLFTGITYLQPCRFQFSHQNAHSISLISLQEDERAGRSQVHQEDQDMSQALKEVRQVRVVASKVVDEARKVQEPPELGRLLDHILVLHKRCLGAHRNGS